jgi:cyclase
MAMTPPSDKGHKTMYRSLIVARIAATAHQDVAQIFAESDRTDLPRIAGVRRRELYSLGDVYIHLLETDRPGGSALADARGQREFQRVSERLTPFIAPYLATWTSPKDAVAEQFYSWTADDLPAGAEGRA